MRKLTIRECEKLTNSNIKRYMSESEIDFNRSLVQIGYNKVLHIGLYFVDGEERVMVIKQLN